MKYMKGTAKFDMMIIWLFFGIFAAAYLDMPYRLIGILVIIIDLVLIIYVCNKKHEKI